MNLRREIKILLVMMPLLAAAGFPLVAQEARVVSNNRSTAKANPIQSTASARPKKSVRRSARASRSVIPPVTLLTNPEYLSGEANVSVAANSNPLLRIGMAQNGVTLIEFPAGDKFFAIHAGNSDLVTVEKSPSLRRDHHLVLRAGSGFLVPTTGAKGSHSVLPATSIIAQMDSGMAITLMIYPVPLLKEQAHRVVINYKPDEVISARRKAGLAINLVGPEADLPTDLSAVSAADRSKATTQTTARTGSEQSSPSRLQAVAFNQPDKSEPAPPATPQQPKPDYKEPVEAALSDAIKNPKLFGKWTKERHGLTIASLPPRELSDSARLVLFAVHNAGREPLRIIAGYPDLYVETLNEKHHPVEAGTKVQKLSLASNAADNLIQPGATVYFALAYEAPILGAQQHLKVVVAQMNAADEPAMADLTSIAR